MFELQLRNSSVFLPAPPAVQPKNEENVAQVVLNDDYSLELLEEKPIVWLEEVVQPEPKTPASAQNAVKRTSCREPLHCNCIQF